MGNREKQKQYEEYITEPSNMAAAIGRRVPYHLEYMRRYRDVTPAPERLGKGVKGKKP